MSKERNRIRGLLALATDAVEHGSRAIERVHRATADRPFAILSLFPEPVALPARGVKLVHDVSLTAVYGSIRIVNQAVAATVDVAFDLAESMAPDGEANPVEEPSKEVVAQEIAPPRAVRKDA
jgi:hypothetical protein